jgi:polygalacturonase
MAAMAPLLLVGLGSVEGSNGGPNAIRTAGVARSFQVAAYGAIPDDESDDTKAIQAALEAAAAAGGGAVVLQPGVYYLSPSAHSWLKLGSKVHMSGAGYSTVLRVKPGTRDYPVLIGQAAGRVEHVSIKDLRIDDNPTATSGEIVPHVASKGRLAIHFSKFDDVTIERVAFDAASGVNTVSMNGQDTARANVSDCRFKFVLGPTGSKADGYDNSAIYIHSRDFIVSNNRFEDSSGGRARTAIEVHGGPGVVWGNQARSYLAGVNVVGRGQKEPVDLSPNHIEIFGNIILGANHAIKLWSITGYGLRNVVVSGNIMAVANSRVGAVSHAGIAFVRDTVSGMLNGPFENVTIRGNVITLEEDNRKGYSFADSGGIIAYPVGDIVNITITGNVIEHAPVQGVRIQSGGGLVRNATVRGNAIVDAGNSTAARGRAGIVLAGRAEGCRVLENAIWSIDQSPEVPAIVTTWLCSNSGSVTSDNEGPRSGSK